MSVKVGVIGAGHWGRKHVDEYSHIPEAELAWVADPRIEVQEACRRDYEVPNTTADPAELLESDVDAVSICVPNEHHFPLVQEALGAGKHVLVEKPITLHSSDARQLADQAKEAGLTLAVGHIYRFNNAMHRLRQAVEEDYFGEVFGIVTRWTNLERAFDDRDVLFDLAPHAFDILDYALGEWPESVTCTGAGYRRPGSLEMAFATARFPSGRLGHLELSWLLPGKTRTVQVMGRERSAWIDCLTQEFRVHESGYDFDLDVDRNNTLRDELEHFLHNVEHGSPSQNDAELGMRTVACIEACHESLKTGRTIDVDYP